MFDLVRSDFIFFYMLSKISINIFSKVLIDFLFSNIFLSEEMRPIWSSSSSNTTGKNVLVVVVRVTSTTIVIIGAT